MISEPLITSLDIRCGDQGCQCERSVLGHPLVAGGYALRPTDEGDICRCGHALETHKILGETLSDYEKQQQKRSERDAT